MTETHVTQGSWFRRVWRGVFGFSKTGFPLRPLAQDAVRPSLLYWEALYDAGWLVFSMLFEVSASWMVGGVDRGECS